LPGPADVREELLADPVQRPRNMAEFVARAGGVEYRVAPRYTYDLYGLVVSRHDASSWWDYVHREWNDNLNVVDLCVVWGENIRRDAYRAVSYSHDQWTCWYRTRSAEAFAAFDTRAISNSHLITDDAAIAEALRAARVGDQIRVRGYLADYSGPSGPSGLQRVSSTVRDDTGNGACEVVYVEDFAILQAGGGPWRALKWLAIGMLVLSVVTWFVLPVRRHQC
jgi:hypothetical protein